MDGCWATAAEMVVKWKSGASYFARPSFEPLLAAHKAVEYLAFILDWYESWGLEAERRGGFSDGTPEECAATLRDSGPLVAIGNLGGTPGSGASGNASTFGGDAHAIAIFGIDQGERTTSTPGTWASSRWRRRSSSANCGRAGRSCSRASPTGSLGKPVLGGSALLPAGWRASLRGGGICELVAIFRAVTSTKSGTRLHQLPVTHEGHRLRVIMHDVREVAVPNNQRLAQGVLA